MATMFSNISMLRLESLYQSILTRKSA